MFITSRAFPSFDSGVLQEAPIHSGGTAPDLHRSSLFSQSDPYRSAPVPLEYAIG
ncbi:hypothetical protein GCM10007416_03140 [Kroppenstedtia guangzhouensis]|uniref:Uncharacterized protein n=1 Tax=Kroppenstedtia guangzhouensis TaxID=1274356 RepID=A0ABQ1FZB9_9BACL|nr:hypothetical protein GCM10007416_03140 [Kroppenstedtia guangzhouensis]